MNRFQGYEPCPRCRESGRDRSGDNLGRYADGSGHCYSCGYHEFPRRLFRPEEEQIDGTKGKAPLPADFTRDIPAAGWKWLLQYGLPYSYWKPYCGYSPSAERLILTFGEPVRFSIGRYVGTEGHRKWKFYGDGHRYVEILGKEKDGPAILVEDLVSAHKVAQAAPCLCLFGTNVHDVAIKELVSFKRPVRLWLDADQYTLLPPKINRLQTFLGPSVGYIHTPKDPKDYSLQEIEAFVKESS